MKIRNLIVATVCLAVTGFVSEQSQAQSSGRNNLFSQYYSQSGVSATNAAMYPAPHPVPRHVGAAYYTYQPLMPHEMMYAHQRDYYNYYASPSSFYKNQCGGGTYRGGYGVTKTTVRWQDGCRHIAPLPGISLPFSRANYFLSRRKTVPRGLFGGLTSHFGGSSAAGAAAGSFGNSGCGPGGCSPELDYGNGALDYDGGGCESCGSSYAANWQQARQASAARTAQAMNNRQSR